MYNKINNAFAVSLLNLNVSFVSPQSDLASDQFGLFKQTSGQNQ